MSNTVDAASCTHKSGAKDGIRLRVIDYLCRLTVSHDVIRRVAAVFLPVTHPSFQEDSTNRDVSYVRKGTSLSFKADHPLNHHGSPI